MAKTPIVPGSPIPTWLFPDNKTRPYSPGRVVRVGNKNGLQQAVSNALTGDTILIDWPGDYSIDGTLVVNAPNVHITSSSSNAADVRILGKGMDNVGGASSAPHGIFSAQPGLRISNLTIADFYYHGITFASGATDPYFYNVRLLDCGQQFIKASVYPTVIDNGRVHQCYFAYTNGRPMTDHDGAGYFYGSAMDVHRGTNWRVWQCEFHEMAPHPDEIAEISASDPGAFQYWWAPAVYFWNRSVNNVVEQNKFHNCGRAVALGIQYRNDGTYDHTGGIIRNNMSTLDAGRFSQEQIDDSDGVFLLWDCPGGVAVHNTVIDNGQMANIVQARWSQNVIMASNLGQKATRLRDSATAALDTNNIATAQTSWFTSPSTGDLHLSATGQTAVTSATRLSQCVDDYDGVSRNTTTRIGAVV